MSVWHTTEKGRPIVSMHEQEYRDFVALIKAKDAEIVRLREALVKIRDMRIGNPTDAIGQHANIVLGIINPTLEGAQA